jgi:hypothetical protein
MVEKAGPTISQHTRQILTDILHYESGRMDELAKAEAIA